MGIIILPLIGLYLALLVWATFRGFNWATARGWTGGKRLLAGLFGFMLVYLPLMWDWVPTELAHRYYCYKEAGLWIYKTVDQWKEENPGVWDTLIVDNKEVSRAGDVVNHEDTIHLNQRIDYITIREKLFPILHIFKESYFMIDIKTGETLGKYINFAYGYQGTLALGVSPEMGLAGYKFWMTSPYCPNGAENYRAFLDFSDSFKGDKK